MMSEGGVLRMGKYEFTKGQMEFIEGLRQPFAVYQVLNKKVVTLVLPTVRIRGPRTGVL